MGCDRNSTVEKKEIQLPQANWEPATHKALYQAIENAQTGDYAVFDFDNTLAIGDISDAVFQYQVENLQFAFSNEDCFTVFTSAIPNIDSVLNDNGVTYRTLATRASSHLAELRLMSSDTFRTSQAFLDFRAEMQAMISYAYTAYGDDAGNLTLFGLMVGMTDAEQRQLALNAADVALARTAMSIEHWENDLVSMPVVRGFGITNEMRSLVKALQAAGVRVCVCSASSQPMVEALAKREFSIDASDVYAIRFQNDENGRMTQCYLPDYPVTLKSGKVDCINRYMRHNGRAPLLVAGDSRGDHDVLTAFDDMKLGLIIDKNQTDIMQSLILQARQNPGHPYCAQSRNFAAKQFVPDGHSVEL